MCSVDFSFFALPLAGIFYDCLMFRRQTICATIMLSCTESYRKVQCLIYQRYYNSMKLSLKSVKKEIQDTLCFCSLLVVSTERLGLVCMICVPTILLSEFWLGQNWTTYNVISSGQCVWSCTVFILYICYQAPLNAFGLKKFFSLSFLPVPLVHPTAVGELPTW